MADTITVNLTENVESVDVNLTEAIEDIDVSISEGGDMFTSVYDTNNDGIVDNAENLGGISSSGFVQVTGDQNITGVKSFGDKIDAQSVLFNPSYTVLGSETQGETYWDADHQTLVTKLNDEVMLQHGLEDLFLGKNQTGADLTDGTPVWFAGTLGASGKILIQTAAADGAYPSEYFIGITTQAIANGEEGFIAVRGRVHHLQTNGANYGETWNDGDILYASTTTPGALTNVPPQAPNNFITVAAVIRAHAVSGILEVRPTWNPKLADLQDVDGNLNTNGQFPVWKSASGYFDFDYNINDYYNKTEVDALILASGVQTLSFNTGTQELSISDGNTVSLDFFLSSGEANALYSQLGHTHTESEIIDLNKYTQGQVDTFLSSKLDVTGQAADSALLGGSPASFFYPASNPSGFISSETDSQTLSYSAGDLTISNGNTVSLSDTVKTTGDQTIGGTKTFSSDAIFNSTVYADVIGDNLATYTIYMLSAELLDSNGFPVLNWNNKLLKDSMNTNALSWDSRALYDSVGSEVLNWSLGNVGIGTGTPSVELDVNGTVRAGQFQVLDGNGITFGSSDDAVIYYDGSNLFIESQLVGAGDLVLNGNSGNVGIGTDSPTRNLTVQGTGGPQFRIEDDDSADWAEFEVNSAGTLYIEPASNDVIVSSAHFTADYGVWARATRGEMGFDGATTYMGLYTNGTEKVRIDTDGNVGIGTDTPTYKLDVVFPDDTYTGGVTFRNSDGAVKIRNTTSTAGAFGPVVEGFPKVASQQFTLNGVIQSTEDTGTVPALNFKAQLHNNTAVATRPVFGWSNYGTRLMTMLANGNVGIGTATPSAPLEVKGAFAAFDGIAAHLLVNSDSNGYPSIVLADNASAVWAIRSQNASDNDLAILGKDSLNSWNQYLTIDRQNGNVGIGTDSPDRALRIEGVSDGGLVKLLKLHNAANTAGSSVGIAMGSSSTTAGYEPVVLKADRVGSPLGQSTNFSISVDAGITYPFLIDPAGNVGIGTDSPSYALEVGTNILAVDTSASKVGINCIPDLDCALQVKGNVAADATGFLALFYENGITPEASATLGAVSAGRALMVQGDGGSYYVGRDVTNNIEFSMGTSTLGEVFVTSSTNHDLSLRRNNTERMVLAHTEVVVNDNSENVNFRVEGNNEANLLFTDAANDRVGIGTSTPAAKLDILGDNAATVAQLITLASAQTADAFQVKSNAGTELVTIDGTDGSMSVGGGALTKTGGGGTLQINSTNPYATLKLKSTTADWGFFTASDGSFLFRNTVGGFTDPFVIEKSVPTNAIRVKTITGNVGIGTSTPAAKLDVNGDLQLGTDLKFNYVERPDVSGSTLSTATTGGTIAAGTYYFRVSYLDDDGYETELSEVIGSIATTGATSTITINDLPVSSDPRVTKRQIHFGTSTIYHGRQAVVSNNVDTSVELTSYDSNISQNIFRSVEGSTEYGNTFGGHILNQDGDKVLSIGNEGQIRLDSQQGSLICPKRTAAGNLPPITIYNTTNEWDDTEYAAMQYVSNVLKIGHFGRGAYSAREVKLVSNQPGVEFSQSLFRGGSSGWLNLSDGGTSTQGVTFVRYNPGFWSASSNTSEILDLTNDIRMSGSAGYEAFTINITETSVGSGARNLVNARVGGVSKFAVDADGEATVAGSVSANGSDVQTQVKAISTIATATYTLVASDAGKHLRFTYAGDVTVTVDDGVHAAKDIITLKNATAGYTITVAAGTNVTIDSPGLTIPDKSVGQVLCWDDTPTASQFDLIGGEV